MLSIEALWHCDKSCRGSTEVSVKTDCGGEEKYKTVWKVALMWPKEEKKKRDDRGGGCLHLITEQCPSYEQMHLLYASSGHRDNRECY